MAGLLLRELDGADAFGRFAKKTAQMAHKIIAIIFFAEMSRHSTALMTAASALYAIASRPKGQKKPSLVEAFDTDSPDTMRPLFAGTGGANLMRGEPLAKINAAIDSANKSKGTSVPRMTKEQYAGRRLRAMLDVNNYFTATANSGEKLSEFIMRRTVQMILNLSPHTGSTIDVTAKAG